MFGWWSFFEEALQARGRWKKKEKVLNETIKELHILSFVWTFLNVDWPLEVWYDIKPVVKNNCLQTCAMIYHLKGLIFEERKCDRTPLRSSKLSQQLVLLHASAIWTVDCRNFWNQNTLKESSKASLIRYIIGHERSWYRAITLVNKRWAKAWHSSIKTNL